MLLLQFIKCIRGSVGATLVRDVLKLCKKKKTHTFFSNISDDVLTETAHHSATVRTGFLILSIVHKCWSCGLLMEAS